MRKLINRFEVKRGIKKELTDIFGLTKKEARWIIRNTINRDLLKIDIKSGDIGSIEDWAEELSEEFEDVKYDGE